jgi:hypothetical protein
MSWSVLMLGSMSVPERNLEEWLTEAIGVDSFPFLDELGGAQASLNTPETLLAALAEVHPSPHEIFEVGLLESQLAVRCVVTEDTWRETAQPLGLLFASAAEFGGVGELTLYGYQGIRFGERVTVAGTCASFSTLAPEALAKLERSPAFLELDARVHERFDALVGRARGPVDPCDSQWVVNPFTGRKMRVPMSAGLRA